MFVTFTRKLPEDQIHIAVVVNTEQVAWAQETDPGWVTLKMTDGPEVIVEGKLIDVQSKLNS